MDKGDDLDAASVCTMISATTCWICMLTYPNGMLYETKTQSGLICVFVSQSSKYR